ncbi:MAG TPA: hypothetical protein VF551_01265, partial [Chthoniobacterales bacterium]
LRSIVPGADRDLETICAKCLERESRARYLSAAELAEDLERWLDGRPIRARRVLAPARLWRWSMRNRMLAGLTAACVLLACAALVWQTQNRRLDATVRAELAASHSVAVLPFLNLDTVAPDSAVSSSITRELQAGMEQIGPARVVSGANSQASRLIVGGNRDGQELGRVLNVRAVLSGTTRTKGARTQFALRLMNAATAEVLAIDVFDVESSADAPQLVAARSASAIYSMLDHSNLAEIAASSRDPGMQDPITRGLLISGRDLHFRYNLADFDHAISCFEKALKLQPASALAHSYLARSLSARSRLSDEPDLLVRAEAAARESLRLAGTAVEARRALPGIIYLKGDIRGAIDEALNTVEAAGPDEAVTGILGAAYSSLGRPDLALSWYQVARQCEARPGEFLSLIADCWAALEQDEKALEFYNLASDFRPDRPQGWIGKCRLLLLQNRFGQARQLYQENLKQHAAHAYALQVAAQTEFFARDFAAAENFYRTLSEADAAGGSGFYGAISYDTALARLALARGDQATADALLATASQRELAAYRQSPANPDVRYQLAAIAALRNDRDGAFVHLREAIANGWADSRSLRFDPRFDSIAMAPEFRELLASIDSKIATLSRDYLTAARVADQ